jgi:hypothetical protein
MATNFDFFSSQSGDGNSAAFQWHGGTGLYWVRGTFGGGTCTLQFSVDGINFISVGSEGELTAAGGVSFWLPPCSIRANLAGSTAPDLSAGIGGF